MEGNILNSNNETFLYEYIKTFFEKSTAFEVHPAVSLIELIDTKNNTFTKEEMDFIKRTSRVDVVVTKGHGKRKAIYVFESDSNLHNSAAQKKRDKLKDKILQKSGINIFRFRDNHYQQNKYGERFIDAVLSSLSNQEFVKTIGMMAWEDEPFEHDDHPLFLVLPYQKEFEELNSLSKNLDENQLRFCEEWCQESDFTIWNKQILFDEKGKQLVSSIGRCSRKEFLYGEYAAAVHFAQMGCLYKFLVNKKILKSEKRPFISFLDNNKKFNSDYDYYSEY